MPRALVGIPSLMRNSLFILAACIPFCPIRLPAADSTESSVQPLMWQTNPPATLDLRENMALAAKAIPPRLDPKMDFRPWFLLKGKGGIPVATEHASWDLADMTGRYLESLILARHMGISSPELSQAEAHLEQYLFKILGEDGLVHDPQTGAIDHSFSQGSALYGLVALFEDSADPVVRRAIERLITGQLKRVKREGDQLIDPSVKLEQSSGSHLAGYQIFPIICFYELTGYPDALTLAEGLTRWAMADPIIGDKGEITKPLSWEGHIHSWLDTLAGCARTARTFFPAERERTIARCRAVYDWVRRSNTTSFGWIATYPTGGSSETCAISSAIRLALELSAAGCPEYLDDVERFVRNQVVEAQFKDLQAYADPTNRVTPLLLGCFDSQSMPNGHLGTRGGEDVGNVEGCCLNGGMRALALAWDAIQTADETGTTVNLELNRSGPSCDVIGYQPFAGRVDVVPRLYGKLRVRVPSWVRQESINVVEIESAGATNALPWVFEKPFVVLAAVKPGMRVSIRYPLRELEEDVMAGGQKFHIRWQGDVVMKVTPEGKREPAYQRTGSASSGRWSEIPATPDAYELQDGARRASMSMLARMDLQREGQPFFRIYPFASPPRAEHEKWDDGDMTGRYVEGLILARRITGDSIDRREALLRQYLAGLFDRGDGLCYTRQTIWTPRRACLFSQSSAMLGLLAWYRETGSTEARQLLDSQADGLMRIAVDKGDDAFFPKYEWDGKSYADDPAGKDAPIWYGGRIILPLVDYWQLSGREDTKRFLDRLVHHCVEVSHFIKPDGAVEQGEGWWGHLHSTMDMAAGIAEYGRLTNRPELVTWAKRIYEWIGRTHTTAYGWVADVSGGRICESCAIASRIRLGLALYRAGALDPFGEIDRFLRNQLVENQFVDVSFMNPLRPETARTDKALYAGIDRMVRGTFQCWGTANDLIGNDDIEGCGAGGGVQGIALALNALSEWRDTPKGATLRVNLLFNQTLRAKPTAPFHSAAPAAAQLVSYLPNEGRAVLYAHQSIPGLEVRLPDGVEVSDARVRRWHAGNSPPAEKSNAQRDGAYAMISAIKAGEVVELTFPLKNRETIEHAAGVEYRVQWKGSSVLSLTPAGTRVPLYAGRARLNEPRAEIIGSRYPW
ncbi:MAG TPA: hypothetical protein VL361_11295 [Candidatus Limnocylindrales bacterium]|nr:hypothetical protein [Candidatus Limnocylindrales bacterium]